MTETTRPTVAGGIAGYEPAAIELKWQARWNERGTNNTDIRGGRDPFYALMMFPYPSAEGLHVGNLFAFTGCDIYGRFQRLQGHNVFEPFGFDAFGIHSENFALKIGEHPARLIPRNIATFRKQVQRAGVMVDWRYELSTTDPAYYKWTQWVFLQLLRQGLAYRKKGAVNWCPNDKTVLANEQVIDGHCERCGAAVEQRFLEQWFFSITSYAKRLLENLDWLDWSESTKTAQRNWIGRSEGAEILFRVFDPALDAGSAAVSVTSEIGGTGLDITVFTTRPDTIFGATYLVLAPEHPLVAQLTTPDRKDAVDAYRAQTTKQDIVSRKVGREKTGAFTGSFALNPATGEPVPIWIADYVLMEYGTGAIMAVPGHDERDYEFASTFDLPIVRVVAGVEDQSDTPLTEAVASVAGSRLVNSGDFDGLSTEVGKTAITEWLASRHAAKPVTNYRLHDWCISRQRYWGPPIPIIYCDECGMQAVPEKDLPVILPDIPDFRPDDSGISPLARHDEWYRVPCPECGKMARRETDVSDTFLDSAWYFLRYPSTDRNDVPFERNITKKWLPVHSYIGGNEHSVLHLLYSRFVTMVLKDAGFIDFEEPFTRFRAHGTIVRDGSKMSKSRGNVVSPDQYIETWGADTFRTYLMFLGPFEEGGDFRDAGIAGVKRFLDRLWSSVGSLRDDGDPDPAVMRKLHQTIRKVGTDIARLGYNTAIAAMMEYMNVLRTKERTAHRAEVEPLVVLVAPFAPHIAEELWERLGHHVSVFDARWPEADAALAAEDQIELVIQVNGKTRSKVSIARDASKEDAVAAALADPTVQRFATTTPTKIVFVPGRLLNLVM